jgi:hypothetical protein
MKWKGTDISTKGLIALTQPVKKKARKKHIIDNIDGSDFAQVTTLGFEPYYLETRLALLDPSTYLSTALAFLDGSGALIDDEDTLKYWNAHIVDEVEFERATKGANIKTADVKFLVTDPFRYLVTEADTTRTTTPTTATNQGTYESLPLLKITGTGTVVLTVNGSSFTYVFDTDHVFIDSQTQRAYHSTTEKTSRMTGDFPKLAPGSNAITWTGTITELVITPRSRFL